MNRRMRRATHRPAPTFWQRMPYSVQLAVTIVLSACSFAVGYALFTAVSGAYYAGLT